MPIATFASGSYTAAFNADPASGDPAGKGEHARDLGLVEGVRYWQRTMQARPITTSLLGKTVIDAVYLGGQCYCRMTLKEWTDVVRDALWPFGLTFGEIGLPGRLLSDLAGELTLTARPGTPAAENGPSMLIFRKAILAPEQEIEIPLGETARDIPIVMQCFPYIDALGRIVWFEQA